MAVNDVSEEAPVPPTPPGEDEGVRNDGPWLHVLDRVIGFERLLRRYPPLGERDTEEFGRVLLVAYLQDKAAGAYQNCLIDNERFFEAPAIKEAVNYDDEACRIVVRMFGYKAGTRVRFWCHRRGRDDSRMDRTALLTERGIAVRRGRH